MIKVLKPKIIVSNDYDHRISEVKKIDRRIKTLICQHNSMFVNNSKKNIFGKNLKTYSYDYFFVYDEYSKKLFSKFIKANYKISGSLKYNEFIIFVWFNVCFFVNSLYFKEPEIL